MLYLLFSCVHIFHLMGTNTPVSEPLLFPAIPSFAGRKTVIFSLLLYLIPMISFGRKRES